MKPEINIDAQENQIKLTRRAKLLAGTAAVGLAVGLGAEVQDALDDPVMKGDQLVIFGPGATIDGTTKDIVKNGSDYTGLVRIHVKKDPRNTDLQDGVHVGDKAYFPEEAVDN